MNVWSFVQLNGKRRGTLTFHPHLSMNDYAGFTGGLLAGTGIRDLPALVQLLRSGKLVEVMAKWSASSMYGWCTWETVA